MCVCVSFSVSVRLRVRWKTQHKHSRLLLKVLRLSQGFGGGGTHLGDEDNKMDPGGRTDCESQFFLINSLLINLQLVGKE